MLSIFIFFVALIFIITLGSLLNYRRIWFISKRIPGPRSFPVIGNAVLFLQHNYDMTSIFQTLFAKYGDIFKIWIGTRLYVVLANSSAVQSILSSKKFVDKNSDYSTLHEWLGTGVATANGEKWFRRRKLLNKAFTFSKYENVCKVACEQSQILIEILEVHESTREEFDISSFVARCVMDILGETGMNTKLGCQKHLNEAYFRASERAAEILFYKMLRPWTNFPFVKNFFSITAEEKACYKTIHSYTEKIIQNRKQARKNDVKEDVDNELKNDKIGFLDLLLDAQAEDESITDKDIRFEIDTFMFGGQDTVSTNLTWILRMLSVHQDVQEKVRSEITTIIGNGPVQNITQSCLAEMKYTESVIKETLRLYPSGPVFNREVHEDFILENGMTLPRGCSVQINAFLTHRNPKYFPNPEQFFPERFLNQTIHPFTFLAYSSGIRNCIGQSFARIQEKVILAFLFSRYIILPGKGMERIQHSWDLVLRPKFGAVVKLVKI